MTWEEPWSGVPHGRVMYLKINGERLKIPPPERLDQLPGTDRDRAAFPRVAAQYTKLIRRVRLRSKFWGVHAVLHTVHMCCLLQARGACTCQQLLLRGGPCCWWQLTWAGVIGLAGSSCLEATGAPSPVLHAVLGGRPLRPPQLCNHCGRAEVSCIPQQVVCIVGLLWKGARKPCENQVSPAVLQGRIHPAVLGLMWCYRAPPSRPPLLQRDAAPASSAVMQPWQLCPATARAVQQAARSNRPLLVRRRARLYQAASS